MPLPSASSPGCFSHVHFIYPRPAHARLLAGIATVVALFDAPKTQIRQLLVLLNHFH